jgi:hypothetical protein
MKTLLLLLALAVPLAAEEPVRTYDGTVVIGQSPAPDAPAMIVIDKKVDGVTDGVADVVYLFYVEPSWNGTSYAAREVHIEDRGGKQLVVTGASRKAVLSLSDVAVTETTGALDFVRRDGYGLARYWNGPVTRIRIDPATMELSHVCDEGVPAAWCPE